MMKFVHVDLKGAPFRPRPFGHFWECFCAAVARWGATGIVVEWEDSVEIPLFENDLETFAYTYGEAGWIVETARNNNLEVIPLVQTFGHMEYILKYDKRKYLREDPDFPNCLAAIDKRQFETDPSFKLVSTLIDQIIELTPNCPAIHLGGDEVWHLGTGPKSQSRIRTNPSLTRDQIYLEHMTVVVKYVRAKYPEKRILIWDDMLRHMSYQSLISWGDQLLDTVEPVVWNYTTHPAESLGDDLWMKYQQIFKMMWIGTAFKGASSPNAQFTPVQLHVTNHLEWLKLTEDKKYIMPRNIQGWILTGWQRFDHFASLCELLPVGLPSLCCCLAAIQSHHFGDAQIAYVTNELGIDISAEFGNGSSPFSNSLLPTYPGGQLFSLMQEYTFSKAELNNFTTTETFATWFNDYYVEKRRVSPLQVRSIRASLENYSSIFQNLEHSIKNSLCQVYPNPVVSEWLGAYIKPITRDLAEKLRKIYSVMFLDKDDMSYTRPILPGLGGSNHGFSNMSEVLEKIVDAKLEPMETRIMAKLTMMQQQILQSLTPNEKLSSNKKPEQMELREDIQIAIPIESIPMPSKQPSISVKKFETSNVNDELRDLLEIRLKPLVNVIEKVDWLVNSEKENKLRTTKALESLEERIDELDGKTRDVKGDCKEAIENTDRIISKMIKIHDIVSRFPTSKDLELFEKASFTLKELNLPKLLSEDFVSAINLKKKTAQGISVSQPKKSSKRKSKELSDDDEIHEESSKRECSTSLENRHKKRHHNGKKLRKGSPSSSSGSDDDDSDEKNRKSVKDNNQVKYLSKVLHMVDELDGRIESWIKSSKKAIHKSDETTNCILSQMLANNKALESLMTNQRFVESQLSDLKSGPNSSEDSSQQIVESITSTVGKLEKCLEKIDSLQKDQNLNFHNLSNDIMSITDRTNKLNKLDEISSKCKSIFQIQSNQELILAKLEDLPATLTDEDRANRDLTLILRDLIPRMDDFYTKVLPVLDDLKRLQRQAVDHDELQEKQNNANLQKILYHLEEIGNKSTKPTDPRVSLQTDTTLLQVFSAINDIKTRDLANNRLLSELQSESQKSTTRLNELLKHKSKTESTLEALVQSGVTDTKTLATINTNVQAMRTSSAGYDAKFVGYFREIRQIVNEAKTPLGNIEERTLKILDAIDQEESILQSLNFKTVQQSLADLKTELKTYADLQRAIQIPQNNQNGTTQVNGKSDAMDCPQSELSSVSKELLKLSCVASEILNSVEDMKQLSSSVPHTVHDLMPKMEKISSIVSNLPNEVLTYTAALEENLGKNLEKCMKDIMKGSLGEIFSKFDLIEQRMAVIKKYAKYGGNIGKIVQPPITKFMDSDGDTLSKASSIHESDIISDDAIQCIIKHISDECRILGDSIAKTMDHFIAAGDTSTICQTINNFNSAIFKEVLENQKTIIKDQAKALEVEEHIESTVATILRPIQGLLPLQEELVKAVKSEINRLKSDYKRPVLVASQMQGTLADLLNESRNNNSLLTDLKRFFHFSSDDRLSDLLRSKVEASLENHSDDPAVFQADAVRNLFEFMVRVQATQHDILKNSDKSVEYQTALNNALSRLIPLLEVINSVLQQRKRRKLHSAEIENLCNELRLKVANLSDLESNLLLLKNDRLVNDLRTSMHLCNNVLKKFIAENSGVEIGASTREIAEVERASLAMETESDQANPEPVLAKEHVVAETNPFKSRLLPKKRRLSNISEGEQTPILTSFDDNLTENVTASDSTSSDQSEVNARDPSSFPLRRLPSAGERKSFSKKAMIASHLDSEGSALETSSNADSPLGPWHSSLDSVGTESGPSAGSAELTPQKLLVGEEIIKQVD